ncbi:MAG: hypothetical protein UHO11_01835 [Treponema sp.]|nr:hypothetical protein [Treponema sp.]
MSRKLSESTKKRLFMLLNFLEGCEKKRVTSREIALLLGIKDSLVRYDFVQVGLPAEHRGFRNGYDVKVLEEDIKSALGILGEDGSAQKKRVCVVGLGRLGAAFLDNDFFEKSGFEVCAGFDSNLNRVELLRSTFELFPASRIETVCPLKKIEYAVLCCSETEVQKMADRLVKAGIKGIVNYTNAVFSVPEGIKVQNVSPVVALSLVEKEAEAGCL